MRYVVKRLGIKSMLKMYAAMGFVVGLIYGLLVFLMMLFGGLSALAFGGQEAGGGTAMVIAMGIVVAIVAVIGMTIGYALLGAIFAIVYNLLAKTVGGIETELEEK